MLKEYNRKRDFGRTPEPAGEEKAGGGNSFVVQKHAASRLHYDFRLEMEGVLRSWAVPKGPSLDPADKRLAVHVEDHPLEYGGFEGIIPKGEYGGGSVVVWDRGTWSLEEGDDPVAAYRDGMLKFSLHGEKLKGSWALFRMGRSSKSRKRARDDDDDDKAWMLIKHRDAHAISAREYDLAAERPESVLTGRTVEEVGAEADNVWRSNRSSGPVASGASAASRATTTGKRSLKQRVADEIRGIRAAKAPPKTPPKAGRAGRGKAASREGAPRERPEVADSAGKPAGFPASTAPR
jgi:bifunctional non-homologous end joining protein LigD